MDSSQLVAITGHQITFQFQLGLVRDRVSVDSNELNLNSLKVRENYVCSYVKNCVIIIYNYVTIDQINVSMSFSL